MTTKREARLSYYAGIRGAMLSHIETTEQSIRTLSEMDDKEKEKLLKVVRKRHRKLLKQIEDDMAKDGAATES